MTVNNDTLLLRDELQELRNIKKGGKELRSKLSG